LHGNAVARLEVLVRTAVFKSANALVGGLLQQAADRIDAQYQPKARQTRKRRVFRCNCPLWGGRGRCVERKVWR
jgi:hypothetical protein